MRSKVIPYLDLRSTNILSAFVFECFSDGIWLVVNDNFVIGYAHLVTPGHFGNLFSIEVAEPFSVNEFQNH